MLSPIPSGTLPASPSVPEVTITSQSGPDVPAGMAVVQVGAAPAPPDISACPVLPGASATQPAAPRYSMSPYSDPNAASKAALVDTSPAVPMVPVAVNSAPAVPAGTAAAIATAVPFTSSVPAVTVSVVWP